MSACFSLLLQTGFYERINWTFHWYFTLFFLVLGSVLLYRAKRENKGWKLISDRFNLIFQDRGSQRLSPFYGRFKLLSDSVVQDPTQVLAGRFAGRDIVAFNWFSQSDTSVTAIRSGFAAVLIQLPKAQPRLVAFHEELAKFARYDSDEIMVLDDDPFAKTYRLLCRNRKFADSLLSPKVRDQLLAMPFWIEIEGDQLLVAWQGIFEPDTFEEHLDRAMKVLA